MSLASLATRVDSTLVGCFYNVVGALANLNAFSVLVSRVTAEWKQEFRLLQSRWKTIGICLILQYVHGIFTQLVFRLHVPAKAPIKDIGFLLTPELGPEYFWVSELLFTVMFASFIIWSLSPFWSERKTFYSVVLYKRLLVHLCCCQALRVISFMSTILPGPAHHCRLGAATARREWVHHWWQHLVVDVQRQSGHSCGDLIFSSHTTFILAFLLCYLYYGKVWAAKAVGVALAAVLSFLIIASRKHYTVDVVIAWYTVPLVFLALERRWTVRRTEPEPQRALDEIIIVSDIRSGSDMSELEDSMHSRAYTHYDGSSHPKKFIRHSRSVSQTSHNGHSAHANQLATTFTSSTKAESSGNLHSQQDLPQRMQASLKPKLSDA